MTDTLWDHLPTGEGVYVLLLEENKYYVGHSKNLRQRVQQHFLGEGNGAVWTALYPPLMVLEYHPNHDRVDEDNLTLRLMQQYGWQNVRGGSYVQVDMAHPPHQLQERMTCFHCRSEDHLIRHCPYIRPRECTRCGRTSHTERDCFASFDVDGRFLPDDDVYDDVCFRCGRPGHWERDCYARSDVYGRRL